MGFFDLFRKKINIDSYLSNPDPRKSVMAAYSRYRFLETAHSDFVFEHYKGLYWCYRVGNIKGGDFGFGAFDGVGFKVNGYYQISRRNVSAKTFEGKGLSFTKEGDIWVLYTSRFQKVGNQVVYDGFSNDVKRALDAELLKVAKESTADSFREAVQSFKDRPKVKEITDRYRLILEDVVIESINAI